MRCMSRHLGWHFITTVFVAFASVTFGVAGCDSSPRKSGSAGAEAERQGRRVEREAWAVADLRDVPGTRLPEAVAEAAARAETIEFVLSGPAVDDELLETVLAAPGLRRLRLQNTSVGDATIARLAESNRLELLYLIDAAGLTERGVRSLGTMTRLRNLRISGPAVDDDSVVALATLGNLAALALRHTAVTDAGVEAVAELSGLKELSLFGTPVTDAALPAIARLQKLSKLRLRQTKVTGENAAPLATMPVVELELAETGFSNAGMESVAAMPQLEKLNLWLTRIDDAGLEHLSGKTQLTRLNLDNVSGITDRSLDVIGGLGNLRLLHLGGTGVTEAGLPKLYGLKKLETLFITRLGISDEGVEALKAAMPWLETVEA